MNDQVPNDAQINPDPLLNDEEAARILGSTKDSMRQSRYTGYLFGENAPLFIKMGRSARYKLSELLKFRDQFPAFRNTAEIPTSRGPKK